MNTPRFSRYKTFEASVNKRLSNRWSMQAGGSRTWARDFPGTPVNPKEKDTRNVFVLPPAGDLIFVEPIRDPADAHTKPSPEGGEMSYYPEGATWEFKAVVSPKAVPGPITAIARAAAAIELRSLAGRQATETPRSQAASARTSGLET